MKFSEIVSISGLPGLKRVMGQRADGLIISELDGSGKKFIPSRKHLFSPLESISIYTYEDSVPLLDIFLKMKDTTPVDANSDANTLREYLETVLPDFDKDRVHINDIKKLIKWFHILEANDLIHAPETKEAAEKAEPTE
ncbi:MAG TPA: DUF5606 domain-containing protein [Chitinophagales bacterium]|nr:DUF5606 domain-containing protein [Chitinophagales bacterium]